MKILFIGPLPDPVTGQSLACQVLLEELKKENFVSVINLSKSSYGAGLMAVGRIFEIIKILFKVNRQHDKYDLIYFTVSESLFGNIKDLLVYLLCYRSLHKMVIHLHGGAGMIYLMNDRYDIAGKINRFFLDRVGAIIVLGDRLRCVYAGIKNQSKIFVVKNFAQEYLYLNSELVEKKYSSMKLVRLLYLSNLLPGKGYIELLGAFKALPEEIKNQISLDFAGGFESEKDKYDFLNEIKQFSQICYHGLVGGREKQNLFANSHVFCLPTYYPYEGQPISILEAYASGCVVIATDHSGILDIFQDEKNGFLVEKRSIDSLQCALESLLHRRHELHRIALANLKLAENEYTVSNYNANLIKVFEFVTQNKLKVKL